MITLDVSTALFVYLFVSVVSVLTLWVFFGYRERSVRFSSDEDLIRHCTICAHTYIDSWDKDISKCPRCGSMNERIVKPDRKAGKA